MISSFLSGEYVAMHFAAAAQVLLRFLSCQKSEVRDQGHLAIAKFIA
jgi:hypothetical protein